MISVSLYHWDNIFDDIPELKYRIQGQKERQKENHSFPLRNHREKVSP